MVINFKCTCENSRIKLILTFHQKQQTKRKHFHLGGSHSCDQTIKTSLGSDVQQVSEWLRTCFDVKLSRIRERE